MKRLISIVIGLCAACSLSFAQVDLDKEFFSLPDTVTNEYLDSLKLQVQKPNDYWMIGVYGGMSAQFGYWNPSRLSQAQVQFPVYGFSVIRQFTMFGLFPFRGLSLARSKTMRVTSSRPTRKPGTALRNRARTRP